jgi:hypothetical protein
MTRTLREVIASAQAQRRAKIAAAYRQKLIAKKKRRQLEKAKRVLALDHKLIVIAALIIALPIIAALAAMLTALAVGVGHNRIPVMSASLPESSFLISPH